jgi:uncharacterized protein (TIGR04222 family)
MKHSRHHLQGLILAALLFIPGFAKAETVTSWHDDITVDRSGTVTVKETIVYDPQDGTHHGIIREVPAQFTNSSAQTYYTRLELVSVTDDKGRKHPIAEKVVNRSNLYLKIGDKDVTISGPQTYVITYTITPLVQQSPSGDRLIINVVGNGWQTPIEMASATVKFAPITDLTRQDCFTGVAGSTARDCTVAPGSDPTVLTAKTTRILQAGEAFTIDLVAPSQQLGAYLVPGQRVPLNTGELINLWALVGAIGLSLVALGRRLITWWQDRARRRDQIIVPQYEPPKGFTPAHMSILESPQADVADVTATLIDLAVRGFIKIEQIRSKRWYRSANYRLTKLTPAQGSLAPFESKLLNALFKKGDQVETKNISTTLPNLSNDLQSIRRQLGEDLQKRGSYAYSPTSHAASARVWLPLVTIGLGVFASILAYQDEPFALVLTALTVLTSLGCLWLALLKVHRTHTGATEWAHIKGFKWYLEVAEKDRINFTDAPERTPELFNRLLPYAVALKVEKQWAKQFAGIDVAKAVGGWYGGYAVGNFTADSFTSGFSSSFGGAVSSNFSGASGSGSSGGGGGGGGGGGW